MINTQTLNIISLLKNLLIPTYDGIMSAYNRTIASLEKLAEANIVKLEILDNSKKKLDDKITKVDDEREKCVNMAIKMRKFLEE